MPIEDRGTLRQILLEAKTIAVVGASPKPGRDSRRIMQYLISSGYTVFPVNPNYENVLGLRCYPNLSSTPGTIDIVDIFRRPEDVMAIVEEAIRVGARTIWMQFGAVNPDAAARAEQAGLRVVMDRCIFIEHSHLIS